MKLAFISNLQAKAAGHKKMAALVYLVVFAAICAGAYFGWQQYQFRQSSLYAFEKIKEAINPPDPEKLARLADFNALSGDLASALAKEFPFFMAGPDQERNIKGILQTALLKKLLSKEEKNNKKQEDESEEAMLQRPLEILPPDFQAQLLEGLKLNSQGKDTALLTASIENPLLQHKFTLAMQMRATRDGWKIQHIVNAADIARQLRAAMLERHVKLRNVYLKKNSATASRMDQLLPVQSCTANAGLLSDGKTLLMVVQVLARNKGNLQVNNFNLDTTISGGSGNVILRRYLNAAKPVAPGEDFDHRWNFELDGASALGQSILRGAPLQCSAFWQTLGLSNGEVLHIVEVPNPDRKCQIAGHDHPEGFCLTPVFNR